MKKTTKIINLLCILLVFFTFAACNPSSNNINDNREGENGSGSVVEEDNNAVVQSGYTVSGSGSEPSAPFWCAYSIARTFDEADVYEVQLSFGTNETNGWDGCDHVVISIENHNGESYIYEELTAEEFFTEKYGVEINYTYIDYEESNGNIYQEVDKEIFTFSYTEDYQIPNSLCEGESGRLDFCINAYVQDEVAGIGFQDLYYRKSDGQIHFMTVKEYSENLGGTSVSKVTGTFGWYDDSDIGHPLSFAKVVIADVNHFTFTPAIYTDENGQFEYTYSTASVRNINIIVYVGMDNAYAYTLTAPSVSSTTLHFSWVVPRDSDMWQALQIS